jgi:hypothetical protein
MWDVECGMLNVGCRIRGYDRYDAESDFPFGYYVRPGTGTNAAVSVSVPLFGGGGGGGGGRSGPSVAARARVFGVACAGAAAASLMVTMHSWVDSFSRF